MSDYDVIIIGANTPALITASYLGKEAGLKTLIVEKNSFTGATAMLAEMTPGYKFNAAATGEYYVDPKIDKDFQLQEKYGLEKINCSPLLTTTFGDGQYMSLHYEVDKTQAEIARFSERDAEAYRPWIENWLNVAKVYGMAKINEPPSLGQLVGALSTTPEMEFLCRDMLFGTVKDCLDNVFENDYVKAAFLTLNEGSSFGPSAGSFFNNIGRVLHPWGFIKGGMEACGKMLTNVAEDHGATIKLNTEVAKILTKDGEAYGIKTKDGEEITAKYAVVSELEWPKTFYKMTDDADSLPPLFKKGLREIKYELGGVTLNLALDKLPDFGFPEDCYNGMFGIAKPGYQYFEEAYAATYCERIPEKLCSMSWMPSVIEPGFYAPEGKHVLTGYVFPLNFEGVDWKNGGKETLLERWIDSLDAFAPGLKQSVVYADGYSPIELQEIFGMSQGDLGHGTMRWYGNFFYRPFPGYTNYRAPIKNLYMGGQNVWPRSGVGGIGGFNVAMAILRDKKFIK